MSETEEVEVEEISPETPEVEEQARAMGWAPKEDWRGPEDRWVDAQTFVDRGKDKIPILNERIRHQSQQINELKATMAEFAGHYSAVQKKAYERALKDLKSAQAEAVAEGDREKFAAVDQQIELMRQHPPSAPNITPPDPSQDPVFQDWLSDNKWYQTDQELGVYAESVGNYIRQRNPGLVGGAFLEKVTDEVKKRFPERFGVKNRPVPTVEGARGANPKPNKGKSYNDLPVEAKQACDKFVKQGLLTQKDYIRDFFGEQ